MFSSTPLIFGNYATAAPFGAVFLPNYYVANVTLPGGVNVTLDTPNELNLSENVTNYIMSVLNSKFYTQDFRNTVCTDSTFKNVIAIQQAMAFAVIYSKGHRDAMSAGGYTNYGLVMNNGVTVWDTEIYARTSSKNIHSFIWYCETGIIPSPNNGTNGLPIAFTHNPRIPLRGTSGNQVYLGWTNAVPKGHPLPGGSPQYEMPINTDYNYAQVACLYYYYLDQGCSTAVALNQVAATIYGSTYIYPTSPLFGWLLYYGNGNNFL